MAAPFSVTWSNNGGNLEELQSCMSHAQSSRPGMLFRNNFLSYRLRNHQTCNAQKLSNLVVNNFSGSSAMNISAARSDEKLSSHSSSSSVLDHGKNKIYSTRKRIVDMEEDFSGKLDQWVKDSVVEIVNYLDEAPFLVHIYPDGEDGSTTSRKKNKLVKEKAVPERWPLIKERWDEGSPTPNGIILVEEMKCGEEGGDYDYDYGDEEENFKNLLEMKNKQSSSSSCNRVWGILIQGKGANYPACYLLKTCRVPCVSGFCTHFCLVRVGCFFEHLDIQFKKLWLL